MEASHKHMDLPSFTALAVASNFPSVTIARWVTDTSGRKSHIFFLIIIRRPISRRVNQRRVNPSVYRAKRVQMLLFHLQFHRRDTACKLRYFNPKQRKILTRIYSLHYGFKMLWIHLQRKKPPINQSFAAAENEA